MKRSGWFLVWTATVLVILSMVEGNTLAYPAAVAGGIFSAIGVARIRGTRRPRR